MNKDTDVSNEERPANENVPAEPEKDLIEDLLPTAAEPRQPPIVDKGDKQSSARKSSASFQISIDSFLQEENEAENKNLECQQETQEAKNLKEKDSFQLAKMTYDMVCTINSKIDKTA